MNAATWVAIALAAVYLPAGLLKLVVAKSRLVTNPQFGWAAGVSDQAIKAIGAAEILGAVGVIAPRLTGVAPVLGVLAAWGLAAVQVGAIRFGLSMRVATLASRTVKRASGGTYPPQWADNHLPVPTGWARQGCAKSRQPSTCARPLPRRADQRPCSKGLPGIERLW